MDAELREKIKNLRKLEHQAKQLLRKMDRLETEWNELNKEIADKGHSTPKTLGDVLAYWQKKSIS